MRGSVDGQAGGWCMAHEIDGRPTPTQGRQEALGLPGPPYAEIAVAGGIVPIDPDTAESRQQPAFAVDAVATIDGNNELKRSGTGQHAPARRRMHGPEQIDRDPLRFDIAPDQNCLRPTPVDGSSLPSFEERSTASSGLLLN